jgi:hypothetical protein
MPLRVCGQEYIVKPGKHLDEQAIAYYTAGIIL